MMCHNSPSLFKGIKMDDNKSKALAAALSQIEKQFGKGSIMRLGEHDVARDIQVVSTGSLGLDIALGVGGLPRGRVIEIYGPESSGKTTLTLQVIAEMQKLGGTAAFIDAEHALDPQYAQKLGVKVEDLLISQPDNGEQALEIVDMLVRSAAVDIVVIDSVAALTPKAEIEGEMGDAQMGLHARLMSQALRKLTANINRSNTMVIFINQIRMKIGVMFGNPETTTGGNALKFYASVRMDIRRRSAKRYSIFCMVKASPEKARSSTSACSTNWWKKPVPGMPTRARRSGRAKTTHASICANIPKSRGKSKTKCVKQSV
jgi:recombination protein RecA